MNFSAPSGKWPQKITTYAHRLRIRFCGGIGGERVEEIGSGQRGIKYVVLADLTNDLAPEQLQLRNTHVLRLFTSMIHEADIVQADTPFEGVEVSIEVGDRLK